MLTTIADAIAYNARRKPRHPALIADDRVLDYRSLDDRVTRVATKLRHDGLAPGCMAGLCMRDTLEHVLVLLGLIRLGAVVLPMDVRWTPSEKSRVAQFFVADAVVSETAETDGVANLVADQAWFEGLAGISLDDDFPSDPDRPVWLSMSSGTTGRPKGAATTHRHMLTRFMSQAVTLGFCERHRNMLATPLYFGGGRGFTISHLVLGATVILNPPPHEPAALADAINRLDVSSVFLVPTQLRRLLEVAPPSGPLLPDLQILISSGAVLGAEERDQVMRRISPNLVNLFSSTEGGPVAALGPDAGAEKAGTVGQLAYQTEVEIVDANDAVLPVDEVGLIRQRAPWLPDGFYNDPAETRRYFRDGWYYTGDVGCLDADGFLTIVGRAKEMIIRGGVNIFPAEIEAVLRGHPDVRDCAVVPWPSREFGEEVAAFVTTDAAVSDDALAAFCRDRLASYKVPKGFFVLDELPKSALGKVLKDRLAARLP